MSSEGKRWGAEIFATERERELASEVERLREALTKIATKLPDGTGRPMPIWRSEEMAQIARTALAYEKEKS